MATETARSRLTTTCTITKTTILLNIASTFTDFHGKYLQPKGKKSTAHNSMAPIVPQENKADISTFIVEEHNRLINLIRHNTGNTQSYAHTTSTHSHPIHTNNSWIMDSGVTDHISKTLPILNRTNTKHTFCGITKCWEDKH